MSDNEAINVNISAMPAVQSLQNPQSSSSSPVKKNRCGAFVGSKQKLMIINLYKSKTQQEPSMKYKNLMKLISKEIGIGYNTVCNTVSDYKKNKEVKSPNKKKNSSNNQ
ncbi:unnamed protein product [Macrosiphum euphorbiae]|uniref:Uncharacterized protein n=1 Tax=Macrosiphum euphorbiae TaxID=13131 RepID=A0AAV0XZT5_9HEMI|nr:unnamed protein product [Macrosiphum euphorbiae]